MRKEEAAVVVEENTVLSSVVNRSASRPEVDSLIEGSVILVDKSSVYVDLAPWGTGIIYGREFINAKDGFEIAELDLQLRGPGQIYGTMQSGRFSDLKAASLADSGLISETKKCANDLLDQDS